MDFQTAPQIIECMIERAKHGVFGYTQVTDDWYEAYQGWWEKRHHFQIQKDWLIFCAGVVPAISSIVRKMTTVGENAAVMTPVYNIFYNSILNNGRNVLENKLKYDGKEYQIDFDDLQVKDWPGELTKIHCTSNIQDALSYLTKFTTEFTTFRRLLITRYKDLRKIFGNIDQRNYLHNHIQWVIITYRIE